MARGCCGIKSFLPAIAPVQKTDPQTEGVSQKRLRPMSMSQRFQMLFCAVRFSPERNLECVSFALQEVGPV